MAPRSKADANPFRRVLAPIEARLDALEASIGGLHPNYKDRILDRMTQLEEHCRANVEIIARATRQQKEALVEHVNKACKDLTVFVDNFEGRTARSIRTMSEATQRHDKDATALRRELRGLESIIEAQSEQLVKERHCCEQLLDDARQLVSGLEDKVMMQQSTNTSYGNGRKDCHSWHQEQPEDFREAQAKLMEAAQRATCQTETSHIIRKAQRTAASRSPSRRPSRTSSPARSVTSEPDRHHTRHLTCHYAHDMMTPSLLLPPVIFSVDPNTGHKTPPAGFQLAYHAGPDRRTCTPASPSRCEA